MAYSSRDNTISIINEFGKGTSCAKIDSDSAFRLIPIHPVGHEVFGIFWDYKCFVDTCPVMGCLSSCAIFETFSTILQLIAIILTLQKWFIPLTIFF